MEKLRTLCLINGEWRGAHSGATFSVKNPANDEVLANVPNLDRDQVTEAIEAAHHAFPAWRDCPARDRARMLRALGDKLLARRDEFARLITLEQGKPLAESLGEVSYSVNYLHWFAEERSEEHTSELQSH